MGPRAGFETAPWDGAPPAFRSFAGGPPQCSPFKLAL
jgi:hypothetical protein